MSNPLKDFKLSLEGLKLIAKNRGIKGYKRMSEDELLRSLTQSKPVKKGKIPKTSIYKARIEKVKKEFNESIYRFSKLKIKEIRKKLYEIENKKNPYESKIKEIERNLTELEENLFKTKKYYDCDDIEYRGIRNIRDLFDVSIDEDYYKQIIARSAFNSSYIPHESKGYKGKKLSMKEYLNIIKPYLSDMINDHKTRGLVRYHSSNKAWEEETSSEWEIQLTMAINFISSKDSNETRTMHIKSNNVEIMMGSEMDEIMEDLFESFLQKYQEGLEEYMRGSEFSYDSVDALYYNLNKVGLSRGGSYIDFPKWLKNKKSTINPKNNDDKRFQYALTVALNYEKIKKDPQILSKIKPFIDQYSWKEIDFPSHSKDWKKFESNNKSIAVNILYVPHNTEKIRHAYKSKYNLTRESQVILLMMTNGEKWHYLAVKSLSALFRGITCNNNGDFYCLNCFQSYTTENKLKKHKKVCENHDYCYVEMPEEDNKILKYNQGKKSMKVQFIIYADLELLLEKMNTCHNNPEKSSAAKIKKHTPSGYSLFTHCSFDTTKNKLDY